MRKKPMEMYLIKSWIKNERQATKLSNFKLKLQQVDEIGLGSRTDLKVLNNYIHYGIYAVTDDKVGLELGVRYFEDTSSMKLTLKYWRERGKYCHLIKIEDKYSEPFEKEYKTDVCFGFLKKEKLLNQTPKLKAELESAPDFTITVKNQLISYNDSLGEAKSKFCFSTDKLICFRNFEEYWSKRKAYMYMTLESLEDPLMVYKKDMSYCKVSMSSLLFKLNSVRTKMTVGLEFGVESTVYKETDFDYVRDIACMVVKMHEDKILPLALQREATIEEIKEHENFERRAEVYQKYLKFIDQVRALSLGKVDSDDFKGFLQQFPSSAAHDEQQRTMELVFQYIFWPNDEKYWLYKVDDKKIAEITKTISEVQAEEKMAADMCLPWRYNNNFLALIADLGHSIIYEQSTKWRAVQFGNRKKSTPARDNCLYWHRQHGNYIEMNEKVLSCRLRNEQSARTLIQFQTKLNYNCIPICRSYEGLYVFYAEDLKGRHRDEIQNVLVRLDMGQLKESKLPVPEELNELTGQDLFSECFHSDGRLLAVVARTYNSKPQLLVLERTITSKQYQISDSWPLSNLLTEDVMQKLGIEKLKTAEDFNKWHSQLFSTSCAISLYCSGKYVLMSVCRENLCKEVKDTSVTQIVVLLKLTGSTLQTCDMHVQLIPNRAYFTGLKRFKRCVGINIGRNPALVHVLNSGEYQILAVERNKLVLITNWTKSATLQKLLPNEPTLLEKTVIYCHWIERTRKLCFLAYLKQDTRYCSTYSKSFLKIATFNLIET